MASVQTKLEWLISRLGNCPSVNFIEKCVRCGRIRKEQDVFYNCLCTATKIYSPEREREIKEELDTYSSAIEKVVSNITNKKFGINLENDIHNIILRASSLSPEVRRLAFSDETSVIHQLIGIRIRNARENPTKFSDRLRLLKRVPISVLAKFKCGICLFGQEDAICTTPTEGNFCQQHIGYLYIMHNELAEYLADDIVRVIVGYILPEYDIVIGCLPRRSRPAKRPRPNGKI